MKNNTREVCIEQVFNASPERVFSAWTDPSKLVKWYAPEGCTVFYKKIDVRPGGAFHQCISNPAFGDCWAIGEYQEVIPGKRLVFTLVNADAEGNPIDPVTVGFDPEWPAKTLVTVIFTEENGKTRMQMHQTVSEETAKRTGAHPSWLQMFHNLQAIVE